MLKSIPETPESGAAVAGMGLDVTVDSGVPGSGTVPIPMLCASNFESYAEVSTATSISLPPPCTKNVISISDFV